MRVIEAGKMVFFVGFFLLFIGAWMDSNRKWSQADLNFNIQQQQIVETRETLKGEQLIVREALAMTNQGITDEQAKIRKFLLDLISGNEYKVIRSDQALIISKLNAILEKKIPERTVFVDRVVEKPVKVFVEKQVFTTKYRPSPELLTSLREAETRIARWRFFDQEEDAKRLEVLHHIAKAIRDAEKESK